MHALNIKSMTDDRRPTTGVVRFRNSNFEIRNFPSLGQSTLNYTLRAVCYALLAAVFLSACAAGGPTYYLHPTYDFSLMQKVGVLPLENHSADAQAAEKVRKVVVSEFLASGVVDVIDPGQVNRALAEAQVQSISSISAEEYKKVGSNLGVQALIVGSVDSFERINVGGSTFAEVAITLRAIDAETGTILWSANHREGGVGTMGRLFGVGGDTTSEATQKAVRGAVATLFQ